jgi:hypothetical protein
MRSLLSTLAISVAFAATVTAHHSFAAFYHEDQSISIEGRITEFHYVNPHAWVYIEAVDVEGILRVVGAEWSNPARLSQQQVRKDTLKPGDQVVITGSPARDPNDLKIHLKKIVRRSDGWSWAGRGERR